ncbi:extracellular solute-binding protein [Cohnella sp. NL03-T5]|nr:extracellular solute-binding protein [Cohnella silvisoli]
MRIGQKGLAVTLIVMLIALSLVGCGSNNAKESQTGAESESPKASTPAASGEASPSEAKVYPENGLPTDQEVTLKFGFWEAGAGREAIDFAMKSFSEKFPNVKFDTTYSPDIFTIIGTKIAAGDDKDMFDIFSREGVPDVNSLVENKKLEPLEDLWDRELLDTPGKKLKDAVMDGVFENAPRINKTSYFLPDTSWAGGLFFDKTLFEKNGWNQNPQTWDEFTALLETIKASGIIPITFPGVYSTYLEQFSFAPKEFELAEMNGKLDSFTSGYRVFAQPVYTSPESIEKWNRIYELGKKGYFPKGVAALNHTQSQMQVLQHKAAMVSTGSWVENEMKDSTPEGFKWGYMGVPFRTSPDQTLWLASGLNGGMYVWANKPELNKKWAKEFALWLFNVETQKISAAKAGAIPGRNLSEYPDASNALQDAAKEVSKYAAANKGRFETSFREVTLTDPAYNQSTKTYIDAIPAIAEGKQDPKAILEKAEKYIETAIAAQK